MRSRSGYTCVRHVLCCLNTFMWIVGCSILGIGIWLRLAYGGYASLLHQYSALSADSVCLAAGIITFIVAFFGCCGSWFQSRFMLISYFVLIVVVFILETVGCSLTFAYRNEVSKVLVDELQAGIRRSYNLSDNNPVAITWNHIQSTFQCCGVEGPGDWFNIAAWPQHKWVPQSCCIPKFQSSGDCRFAENPSFWYRDGCYESVRMWFINRLHIVGIFGLVLTFIQLSGMIAALLLFTTLRSKRRSRTYKSYQYADT